MALAMRGLSVDSISEKTSVSRGRVEKILQTLGIEEREAHASKQQGKSATVKGNE